VILPKDNRNDILDIPETVRRSMNLVVVDHVDQVIDRALIKLPRASRVARQKTEPPRVSRAVASVN
jgi:ATP-dependent Lon protease